VVWRLTSGLVIVRSSSRWLVRCGRAPLALVLLAAAVMGAIAGSASAGTGPLSFVRVSGEPLNGSCGGPLYATGAYALVTRSVPGLGRCATQFVVYDDSTGRHWAIDLAPCWATGRRPGGLVTITDVDTPWVLFECQNEHKLYDLATRRWEAFRCGAVCTGPRDATVAGMRVGTRWVELTFQLAWPVQRQPRR
jgi:hypothetical protein